MRNCGWTDESGCWRSPWEGLLKVSRHYDIFLEGRLPKGGHRNKVPLNVRDLSALEYYVCPAIWGRPRE
eukprot:2257945-Ditylum_brightwellii.AAC.1